MRAILALGAIVVSTAAWAQLGQNTAVGPDNGFFRPTPGNDPSLTNPPMAAPVPPAQPPQPQPVVVPTVVPVPVSPPAVEARIADGELDRAAREARDAQLVSRPQGAPIVGAFTGNTEPRDR